MTMRCTVTVIFRESLTCVLAILNVARVNRGQLQQHSIPNIEARQRRQEGKGIGNKSRIQMSIGTERYTHHFIVTGRGTWFMVHIWDLPCDNRFMN